MKLTAGLSNLDWSRYDEAADEAITIDKTFMKLNLHLKMMMIKKRRKQAIIEFTRHNDF